MNKAVDNIVRNLGNIPKFEPWKWKNFINAGCYAYILDLNVDKFFLIGSFIGRICSNKTPDNILIKTLKEELEVIFDYEVIQVGNSKIKTSKNEKKICLLRDKHSGYYHLLREDIDKIWSHKYVGDFPTRLDEKGRIINNPDIMKNKAVQGWYFLLKRKEPV